MTYSLIQKEYAKGLLPIRPVNANKGTFGKVLNIAGCASYQGAAYLSSVSPLKIGAGLVTLATIDTVINNLAGATPWITFFKLQDFENKCISNSAFKDLENIINSYNVISVGSGLSTDENVFLFIQELVAFLANTEKKVVLDADALNIIAKANITKLPKNTIITPHPMEMSRLLGISVEEIQSDRVKYAKMSAEKYGCTAILKGNGTVICTKENNVFINTTGNSAMSKAGSGDVLVGIISGLLAQGLNEEEASILGVYLHGLCGDLAKIDLGEYSVMATDLIDYIPNALKFLQEG